MKSNTRKKEQTEVSDIADLEVGFGVGVEQQVLKKNMMCSLGNG